MPRNTSLTPKVAARGSKTGPVDAAGPREPLVAAYDALARRFAGDPRVTLPAARRGQFGTNALKWDGKIFAMLVRGALAVKLPADEVRAASQAGRGELLTMGRGRTMKEWLLVGEPPRRWHAYAERARAFVAGELPSRPARPA